MTQYYWNYLLGLALILLTFAFACAPSANTPTPTPPSEPESTIELPEPRYDSDVSIEQSLLQRRSIRSYTGESLTLPEVAQLLWAAQGVTDATGFRTAPSAGALYPLELYVVAGDVQDLNPGVYRYDPDEHQLLRTMEGDKRVELADAALGQRFVGEGAIVIVFTAVYERTTGKYGDRGIQYVHMEAGHAAQNLCLQATAMDLGVVTVGAFYDEEIAELLDLPGDEQPLYVIPVGRRQ
jgi:SagB-type dehydrogenase family enzyme